MNFKTQQFCFCEHNLQSMKMNRYKRRKMKWEIRPWKREPHAKRIDDILGLEVGRKDYYWLTRSETNLHSVKILPHAVQVNMWPHSRRTQSTIRSMQILHVFSSKVYSSRSFSVTAQSLSKDFRTKRRSNLWAGSPFCHCRAGLLSWQALPALRNPWNQQNCEPTKAWAAEQTVFGFPPRLWCHQSKTWTN